jgi:ABC-type multidrug transport system fused ATPase/permease subunit
MTRVDSVAPHGLVEAWRLVPHLRRHAWAAPVLLALGFAAAITETLAVGLSALFLFAVLGQSEALIDGGGLLGAAYARIGGLFDGSSTVLAAVFFGIIATNAALNYAYQLANAVVINRIAQDMRDRVHEVYVTVGYRHIQEREPGELINTLSGETWSVADAVYAAARIGVNISAMAVFGAGLVALSWQVALTAALCAAASFVLQRLLTLPLRKYGAELLAENQILSERMLVSLHGMRTLRAFAQEAYVLRVFSAASSRVRRIAISAERIKALIGPLGELVSLGTIVMIALVAGAADIDTTIVVAAVMLLFRLQPHLREFESHRLALVGMGASLRAVRETLELDKKLWPTIGKTLFTGLHRGIRFEDVSFSHDSRRLPSLDSVDFTITKGKITALSGPSGSGKSTIINLLLRLYEPDSGRILVDGVDLLTIDRRSWLDRVAVAGQDVELIEGTVEQNIRLAKHDATLQDLRDACEAAAILEDIEAIPDGFASRIGPGGLSFSGGQRQRLGLARALVRKPELLILDEALSALEPTLEDRVRANIAVRMAGGTILLISHRADAAATADTELLIKKGRMVALASRAAAPQGS